VLALAICALAAPFAARLKVQAHAAAPQIAVRTIDIELGHEEEKAEAAFVESLEYPDEPHFEKPQVAALPNPTPAPVPAPALVDDGLDHPLHSPEDPPVIALLEAEKPVPMKKAAPIAPKVKREVAVLFSPLTLDTAIEADSSDEPPAQGVKTVQVPAPAEEEEITKIRVIMTAPPTMTPVPVNRPFHAVNRPITTVPLAEPNLQVPIDVTPPLPGVIEEAPLPPLEIAALPVPTRPVEQVPLSISQPAVIAPIATAPLVVTEPPVLETTALAAPTAPSRIQIPPVPVKTRSPSIPVAPVQDVAPVVVPVSVEEPTVTPVALVTTVPEPARPVPRLTNGPRIALVIAAAGLNENVTRFAIDALPAGITLAFAPVKAEAGALARMAKQDGHTILVEIPLEPVNKSRDPGPMTLRVADSSQQNIERLDRALAQIPVADGASSYLGARFNADERAVGPVVNALAARNLVLFENEPTARSVFRNLSARAGLRYARGIVKFDKDRKTSSMKAALDALERQAREQGSAIGVGTALRSTISTVALWAKEAEKRGVRLVPITQVAR